MSHVFNFVTAAGKTATKVHAYVNDLNVSVTSNGTFYSYNTPGTCLQNIELNSTLTTVTNHSSGDMNVTVYANPASTMTTVSFYSKSATTYHLTLIDAIGREVFVKEGASTAGKNAIDLSLNGLAKGVYQLNLKSGANSGVVRTVIE
jgi:hypothetical protein